MITNNPAIETILWGSWMQHFENRKVKQEQIGSFFISTVFLGIDHNFGMTGRPVLFETLVSGNEGVELGEFFDRTQLRCCTWEEAERQHEEIAEIARTHDVSLQELLTIWKLS